MVCVVALGKKRKLSCVLILLRRIGILCSCGLIVSPDYFPHFPAVNRNAFGTLDADAYFIASDIHDHNLNVVPNHNRLIALS